MLVEYPNTRGLVSSGNKDANHKTINSRFVTNTQKKTSTNHNCQWDRWWKFLSCKGILIILLLQPFLSLTSLIFSLSLLFGFRHVINLNDKILPQKYFLSLRNNHLFGTLREYFTNIINLLLIMIYNLSLWPMPQQHRTGIFLHFAL